MFYLNQAALLSVQLLMMSHVLTGTSPDDHRNTLVSRGDSTMLMCNISIKNASQINWTKGRFYFAYLILDNQNQNCSNFTSHRLRIDPVTTLNIFNVQHEDAGLYTCTVAAIDGIKTIRWNLTVSENPKGISLLRYFLYILPPVTGFLLCGFILAVCIYKSANTSSHRICGTRTQNQDPGQDQFELQSGGEDRMVHRTNNSSHYKERINLIYS